jgi:AraC-like DNA-binding protein
VPPFRAVWIPPNTIHHVLTIGKVRMRFLRIHAKRAPIKGAQCEVLEVSPLLRELIKAFSELNAPGVRESLLTDLMLNELKMAARLPMRIVMPSDKRLKSLCEKLLDEPGSRFTLSDWAKRVGASERTLTRLFDREMGITFNQWRQNMRLSHAAPLIAQGMPLSGVAAELGYASQSAFSAMFKKAFGQSPSEFFAERI